ncbi:MAG: hypothetical protein M3449_08995 [Acidobacteriota bacterium]|jgi:anti-anti-sigma regulatory factor|nr:hypothetical protein [Blastocatellia bacterium]MDQ3491180.1 hypothetical protein [Acidobacteriota bacterium]
MATHITQIDDLDRGTILRVKGEMLLEDALLLERIAADVHSEQGADVTIDLAELDFLDSDSAQILKRLKDLQGYNVIGMEIFLQSAVNNAEKTPGNIT